MPRAMMWYLDSINAGKGKSDNRREVRGLFKCRATGIRSQEDAQAAQISILNDTHIVFSGSVLGRERFLSPIGAP